MMRLSDDPLIGPERIASRVAELGRELSEAHEGEPLVLLCVLKGALPFGADLLRRLPPGTEVDFIRAKSYDGTESTGTVVFLAEPTTELRGKHVVVVEDILDTGLTAQAILERLESEDPASLALCTLLDKPSRRKHPVEAEYVGFTIGEYFVVGYGLDHEEEYRGLPGVYILEQGG